MIPYNTDLEKLVLPEYGRLVHDMIKICAQLENKDERSAFAASIVETMKMMTQEKNKLPDDRKYWDHLFIISGNSLDIDSPFGKPDEEELNSIPTKIPYNEADFSRRHYGNILQRLVHQVALMDNSSDKDACVELLANHIKKLLVMNNPENANNERVYADLDSISSGNITLDEGIFDLPDFKEEKTSKTQKRKKK